MNSSSSWKNFSDGKTPSSVSLDNVLFEKVPTRTKVLDFGCGWGRVSFELQKRGYEVTGFDSNEAEILKARTLARGPDKIKLSKIEFDVEDALHTSYSSKSFDACVVQAFMTTLVNPTHRTIVINEARRVLKNKGVLYISDFGQTWENPVYRERYEKHFPITKEKGTFVVTQDGTPNTPELYRAHHYTKDELLALIEPHFSVEVFKEATFTSYHGNWVNGFVVVARLL